QRRALGPRSEARARSELRDLRRLLEVAVELGLRVVRGLDRAIRADAHAVERALALDRRLGDVGLIAGGPDRCEERVGLGLVLERRELQRELRLVLGLGRDVVVLLWLAVGLLVGFRVGLRLELRVESRIDLRVDLRFGLRTWLRVELRVDLHAELRIVLRV